MDDETKLYEIGYLLLPMLSEESVPAEMEAIRGIVEKQGGVIESAEVPKSRPLAYPISKKIANKRQEFTQAYFGFIQFKVISEVVPSIKSEIEKLDNILRMMLVETVKVVPVVRRIPTPQIDTELKPESVKDVSKESKTVEPLTSEQIDKEVEGLIAEVL
ncbi:MAG: 30S ribosomal protein S6 [Candidatus Vogelbacteria bacterium]|nr:30S ribosomal protein S6 [Candidatus Vogelbacteria bacterium]